MSSRRARALDLIAEHGLTISAGNPLHLAEVFNIAPTTAVRYALNARALLERPHEADAIGSERTR